MGDDEMNPNQWEEMILWLKEDRIKVAVLENQVVELRRANEESRHTQAAILSRLDALRDETHRVVKEAMQEHLQNCLAVQRQMSKQPEKQDISPDLSTIMKHIGAAVAGAAIMVAALWDKLVR